MDGTRTQLAEAAVQHRGRVKSRSISVLFLIAVGLLLLGYAFFDKGFAYIGHAPIYIGEVVLGLGLMAMVAGGGNFRLFRSPITWILLLYVTWQVLILIPGISRYGITALRDSVIWLYAVFAFMVAAALLRSRSFAKVPEWYCYFLPAWAIAAPFLYILSELFSDYIPKVPGSDTPIIWMKPGDMGVQIAGVAAFLALGLHTQFRRSFSRHAAAQEICVWIFLLIGLIACGSRNRGGLVAALAACGFVTLFKPMNRLTRIMLPLLIVVTFAFAIDLNVPVGGGRTISLGQISENLTSVFVKTNDEALDNTENWRMDWWTRILDDTIYGDNFWTGVGYGISLAKRHGFADSTGNRSPHNGHLTILARSGVPGLVLWVALLGAIFFSLLRGAFRARAMHQPVLANLSIWVLSFFMAFVINASVDVFLEGPQGGIWFWCLVGYAIALTEEQRVLLAQPARAMRRSHSNARPVRRRAER
jgi:O-antigen ligase